MANDLARWQFATTTIYHFFFVPVTIGLAFLVAILQTVWYRTDNPDYKRMTRFFGTLLLINVAIGVVTGLVQEFQFGMNWSTYSRYVGGVFGAPLAMEGILAFFLESTFLGAVDIRVGPAPQAGSPRVHLGGVGRDDAFGDVHPDRQLVDAAPGRLQDQQPGPGRAEQRLGAVRQPDVRVGLRARDARVADHRVPGDARRVGVVPAQGRARRVVPSHREGGADRADPDDRHPAVGRQPARRDREQVSADEDRRRRGAVDQLQAVLVLGAPDRRRRQRQDADGDHPDPAPAVGPGHWHLERAGHRAQPAPGAVRGEVRAGELRARRVHPVLVDAGDGLPGERDTAARALGRVAPAQGPPAQLPAVPDSCAYGRSSHRS